MKNRTNSKLLHFIIAIIILVVGCFLLYWIRYTHAKTECSREGLSHEFCECLAEEYAGGNTNPQSAGFKCLSRY